MTVIIIGRGRMGTLIRQTAEAAGDRVLCALDQDDLNRLDTMGKEADVIIDFSAPAATAAVAAYAARTGTPLLSGTTGLGQREMDALEAAGRSAPVLWSANYSLGVAVMSRVVRQMAEILLPDFDAEILETHHNQKADAPSGTAKLLLEAVDPEHRLRPVYGREGITGPRKADEIGVLARRGGTVAGTHTVSFFGTDEELEITHRAASRQIFASGACHVARLLPGFAPGVYHLQDILFGK